MTAPNGKLDVVRKLLAKAEGAATPEEADAYNAKAAELIARYGIDSALLADAGEQADPIDGTRITIDDPYSREKGNLLAGVAAPLRCRTIARSGRARGSFGSMLVFGYASDRERVELLYTSLLLQATRQLVHVRPDSGFLGRRESVTAYRRTWLLGFGQEVHRRLLAAEQHAARQHDAGADTGARGAELVLVTRTDQVTRAYEAAFPGVKRTGSRMLAGRGLADGVAAGRRADLGQIRLTTTRRQLH